MGKGDSRRVENSKLIDANWGRTFGEKCPAPFAQSDESRDSEIIIQDRDEHHELQREARIARHLAKVLPLVYAHMVKELAQGEL